jgi:HD-like signal output (HDOD) protein
LPIYLPGGGTVLEKRVFEFGIARNAASPRSLAQLDLVRDFPDVPVLSETLLLTELKIRDRAVDLREISQLVLSDIGAVLQIMRLAGREDISAENRPTRIEDCISGLGLQACLEAMSRQPVKRRNRLPAIVETWSHARAIAENCRFLAEEDMLPAHPDEAYLVGLFHAIGTLPEILDWDWTPSAFSDLDLAGLRMAEAWSLPDCVVEYFCELRSNSKAHKWTEIVERAHQLANQHLEEDPLVEHAPLAKHAGAWMQLVSH